MDQKEYLKKYLRMGKRLGDKKKRKTPKKIIENRFKIVDDDVDVLLNEQIKQDLEAEDEDAPQIVAVIDERPPSLRIDEKSKSLLWTPIGIPKVEDSQENGIKLEQEIKLEKKSIKRNQSTTENAIELDDLPVEGNSTIIPFNLIKTENNDDYLPPRRGRPDSDSSPPRRRKISVDQSPPRRKKPEIDDDSSPPRRKSEDSSPLRRRRIVENDLSPPRRRNKHKKESSPRRINNKRSSTPPIKMKAKDSSSPSNNNKIINHEPGGSSSPSSKSTTISQKSTTTTPLKKTLDGKKAGLQNALDLAIETYELKKKEDELFKTLSADVSGENAATVVRGRKKKEIVDPEVEERKRRKAAENKEKYDRWGKGLKQVEDAHERIENEQYEMTKPLARYADDKDLEDYLKNQERQGDPMLAYLRQKKRKKAVEEGRPVIQQYMGDAPPNRYGIRPGYRWDGVDRSSGYEKDWFKIQNDKSAMREESYKWSTEEM